MLGTAGAVAWAELWDELGPIAVELQRGATFSRFDNLLWSGPSPSPSRYLSSNALTLVKRGAGHRVEETYYSWVWSPVFDSMGKFVCASNQSFETTSRIVAER